LSYPENDEGFMVKAMNVCGESCGERGKTGINLSLL